MDLVLTGLHGIIAKSKAIAKSEFAQEMMGDIATLVMLRIKDRTIAGEDVQGHDFIAYSKSYKKWRKKKGYKTSPVDLTLSGHMLSAMTETHNNEEAKIFFVNTSDPTGASAPDKAFWNNKDREFFGLSKQDEKDIMKIVVDYYEKLMGRRTLR